MPIPLTHLGTGVSGSTGITTMTVPAGGVPAGSLIVICLASQDSAANTVAVISNTGNAQTWHEVGTTPTGNTTQVSGDIWYAFNCAALVSGNTIKATEANNVSAQAMTVFYATGIQTASDPQDTTTRATGIGTNAAPTKQLAAVPAVAGSLVLGVVVVNSGTTTFTQDSTNAVYATPPNRIASGSSATDVAVAGGTVVSSSQLTYAPTLSASGSWAEIVVAFKPSAAAAGCQHTLPLLGMGCSVGWRLALLQGASRMIEKNEVTTRRRLILPSSLIGHNGGPPLGD